MRGKGARGRQGASVRRMLKANLKKALKGHRKVGLALSAGTDSLCLLWVLTRDLGLKPTCYTYVVRGMRSDDAQRAQWLCRQEGVPWQRCTVPSGTKAIVRDLKELFTLGVPPRTVNVQCCHGGLQVARKAQKDGIEVIVNGSGVDGLYGSYGFECRAGIRNNVEVFNKFRRKHLAAGNDDAMENTRAICQAHGGVDVVFPYRSKAVIDYLMGLTWRDINVIGGEGCRENKDQVKWSRKNWRLCAGECGSDPFWGWYGRNIKKYVVVKEFTPEFEELSGAFRDECCVPEGEGLWRARGSQQKVAGVGMAHEALLRSDWNVLGRTGLRGFYGDLAAMVEREGLVT